MSLAEIKNAIDALSPQEKCELMAWLHNYPDDEWDRQMRQDALDGKLDFLIKEAKDAFSRGECREFP